MLNCSGIEALKLRVGVVNESDVLAELVSQYDGLAGWCVVLTRAIEMPLSRDVPVLGPQTDDRGADASSGPAKRGPPPKGIFAGPSALEESYSLQLARVRRRGVRDTTTT